MPFTAQPSIMHALAKAEVYEKSVYNSIITPANGGRSRYTLYTNYYLLSKKTFYYSFKQQNAKIRPKIFNNKKSNL